MFTLVFVEGQSTFCPLNLYGMKKAVKLLRRTRGVLCRVHILSLTGGKGHGKPPNFSKFKLIVPFNIMEEMVKTNPSVQVSFVHFCLRVATNQEEGLVVSVASTISSIPTSTTTRKLVAMLGALPTIVITDANTLQQEPSSNASSIWAQGLQECRARTARELQAAERQGNWNARECRLQEPVMQNCRVRINTDAGKQICSWLQKPACFHDCRTRASHLNL